MSGDVAGKFLAQIHLCLCVNSMDLYSSGSPKYSFFFKKVHQNIVVYALRHKIILDFYAPSLTNLGTVFFYFFCPVNFMVIKTNLSCMIGWPVRENYK